MKKSKSRSAGKANFRLPGSSKPAAKKAPVKVVKAPSNGPLKIEPEAIYTTSEVAAFIRVERQKAAELIRNGEIEGANLNPTGTNATYRVFGRNIKLFISPNAIDGLLPTQQLPSLTYGQLRLIKFIFDGKKSVQEQLNDLGEKGLKKIIDLGWIKKDKNRPCGWVASPSMVTLEVQREIRDRICWDEELMARKKLKFNKGK